MELYKIGHSLQNVGQLWKTFTVYHFFILFLTKYKIKLLHQSSVVSCPISKEWKELFSLHRLFVDWQHFSPKLATTELCCKDSKDLKIWTNSQFHHEITTTLSFYHDKIKSLRKVWLLFYFSQWCKNMLHRVFQNYVWLMVYKRLRIKASQNYFTRSISFSTDNCLTVMVVRRFHIYLSHTG